MAEEEKKTAATKDADPKEASKEKIDDDKAAVDANTAEEVNEPDKKADTADTANNVETPKKKSNVPVVTLVMGLVLLALWSGIGFLVLQIPKKAVAVQTLRTQVISTEMSEQDKVILSQALEDTVEERAMLAEAFPDEEKMLNFITLIDQIKETNVEVLKFSVDSDVPTKVGRNPSFLPITLLLKGKNADVDHALKMIVDSPYFINPVNLSKSWDGTGEMVTVQTQFYLYVSDKFSNYVVPKSNSRPVRRSL